MRTTWRATCFGFLALGPLLTACGGDEDGGATADEAATTASSSEAPSTGINGEEIDPDAGKPSEVATDAPATPAAPTTASTPSGSGSSSTQVAPRLTYFGWNADVRAVEAGGIVPAIVESGGRCTLTLTQGGTMADASSDAIDNVTSTSCGEMLVPGDRLSPGTWRAVLTYESATAEGSSEPVDIEVP
jgi:hypothetical protein